jgi:glycine cleavage system regulatory protein
MATYTTNIPDALEPFITDWFFNRLRMIDPVFPQWMNVTPSSRGFEEYLRSAGVGTFVTKPEGTPVQYDDPVQGARVRRVHSTYALGIRVSMELREDDQHGIVQKMTNDLADAARDHRDRLAHDLINNAFVTTLFTGLDAAALCATHTNLKTGTSQSNSLSPAVALSISGIQSALTNMRTTTNESDRFVSLTPSKLLVPPALEFTAAEILDSQDRPDTTDRATNVTSSSRTGVTKLVSEYLTDTDNWFLLARKEQHSLTWLNRKGVTSKSSMDSQTYDELYDAHYRAVVHFLDWRGVVGSAV